MNGIAVETEKSRMAARFLSLIRKRITELCSFANESSVFFVYITKRLVSVLLFPIQALKFFE